MNTFCVITLIYLSLFLIFIWLINNNLKIKTKIQTTIISIILSGLFSFGTLILIQQIT